MKNSAPTTRLFALGLMLLFLPACGSLHVRADAPATDLQVLKLGVEAMTQPRNPQGPVARAEDAETTGQAWGLLLELEDVDYLHEQDKQNVRAFVNKAVDAIAASRVGPCRWWQWQCRARQRAAQGPRSPLPGRVVPAPAPRAP